MFIWIRHLSALLPLCLLVVGMVYVISWSEQSDRFPVKEIEIQTEAKQVEAQEIIEKVKPNLTKGFFWLDIGTIQKNVLTIPWLSSAEIKRIWPDKIVIKVDEYVAQARWNEKGIISTEGHIFYPKVESISEKLPIFKGQDYRAKEILQQYFASLEQLGPVGLKVKMLEVSDSGAWQIMLDNEIAIILGKSGLNERVQRFVGAYQASLKNQSDRIAYVDLRYTNGLAIGWKQGTK